jgi:hypothetical protein
MVYFSVFSDQLSEPTSLSFPSNYSPYVAAEGKSRPCRSNLQKGDKIWELWDGDIASQVINDLHRLRIINKRDICLAKAKAFQIRLCNNRHEI